MSSKESPLKICIAGQWRLGRGEVYPSINPATGEPVAWLAAASVEDVHLAVEGAHIAFEQSGWRNRKSYERAAVLLRIADLIRAQSEELAQLQSLDNGKPIKETRALVASAASTFQYFAAACETMEEQITPSRGDYLTMSVYEPMGVISAITPWNSPVASDAQKLAPALAAGNAVIVVAMFGVRRGLIYGLLLWGIVTLLSPLFQSYSSLMWSRFFLGFSEGSLFSLSSAYIKAYFDGYENGRPNAIVNMGTGLGLAFGFPFVSMMIASSTWQMSFYTLGILNIILGIPLIWAFIRMPENFGSKESPKTSGEMISQVINIFKSALTTRYVWLLTILTSAFLAYLWGSSNWLPAYLQEARGFSLKEMGWLASLPPYASVVGVFVGGILLDKLGRIRVPLIFMMGSAGVALAILVAINALDKYTAAYSIILANFMWGLSSPAIPSTVQFYSKPEHTASAFGVVNGIASLVAGFMPTIMGWVMSSTAGASGIQASVSAGFFAGFSALIGTQVIVFVCGLILWLRQRGRMVKM